jgi:hypothetical protein
VIRLNTPPLLSDAILQSTSKGGTYSSGEFIQSESDTRRTNFVELPEKLSVLFLDDDLVLRKLFPRFVTKAVPT